METVYVNRGAIIIEGILKGISGKVVAFDSEEDEVTIQVDKQTFVHLSSEHIEQVN